MRDQPVKLFLLLLTAALLGFPGKILASGPYTANPDESLYPAITIKMLAAPEIMSVKQLHLRSTRSGDLIIATATPEKNGNSDIIIARIDPDDGTVLAWMTIGGSGNEWVGGLALDGKGRIIITGASDSPDFPVVGGGLSVPPSAANPRRTFLCRIDSDLKNLEQSSLPAPGDGLTLALGKDGAIYVGGRTIAGEFSPKRPGMTPTLPPGPNGFVLKVNPQTWQVTNATFIGGHNLDWVKTMTVNNKGDLVIAGDTSSTDFPFTETAWQPDIPGGTSSGFVAILDPDLKKIKSATAINGGRLEVVSDVTIGRNDSIIVTGLTSSPDFPTTRNDKYHGGGDAFVVKLSNDLKKLAGARIFGGKGMDSGRCLTAEAGTFIVMAMESDSPVIKGIRQPLVNPGKKDLDLFFLGPNLKLLRPAYSGTDQPDHNPALALGEGNRVILAGIAEEKGKARLFLSEHNLY